MTRRTVRFGRAFRSVVTSLLALALVAGAIGLLATFAGWTTRPPLATSAPPVDPEEIARLAAQREVTLIGEEPLLIHKSVDYREGARAAWWPRGESPILSSAVQSGKLPPVAARVGAEPLVLVGPEGIGNYGGTWNYAAANTEEFKFISYRLGSATLLRWSPYGYPIAPNIARAWEARNEHREYVFHLRQGMRWSDGTPFTTEDIRYWWEDEVNDPAVFGTVPEYLMHHGSPPQFEIVDETMFVIRYEQPHTLLPEILAGSQSASAERGMMVPAHYLRQFHPRLGDQETIRRALAAFGFTSARQLYLRLKEWDNPECPRLWPWIYRTYKPNSPIGFVRNPYYFAVDAAGNQLPYLDRLLMTLKSPDLVALAAANGETHLQFEQIRFDNYTHLMEQRQRNGYEVRHWYAGNASPFLIYPNLNRYVDPHDPSTAAKRELLNRREFRQAMSLAIDRHQVSRAEFGGLAPIGQLAPVPESPLYEPELTRAFVEHDPTRANVLLDSLGLTGRDAEGFRTFPDGSRLQFFLNIPNLGYDRMAGWICSDWAEVGVRVTMREQDVKLFMTQLNAGMHDFTGWSMNGKIYDLIEPKNFVASLGSYYALNWGRWFSRGGLLGVEPENPASAYPPPPGHPMLEAMRLTDEARIAPTREEQIERFRGVLQIAAREVWEINAVRPPFIIAVVRNDFRNVPPRLFYNFDFLSPFNGAPETFHLEHPNDSPGAIALMQREVVEPTALPGAPEQVASSDGAASSALGRVIRGLLWGIVALAVVLIGLRHRFIGHRLMIMVPTLVVVSICTFVIIQLPEGDYLDSLIVQLENAGGDDFEARVEDLRRLFHMDESPGERYLRWVGLKWFATFDSADRGLLQGDLGRSMETLDSVNRLVGERILLTIVVSLVTILFTWAVALPIGVYSAVRQHTVGDYAVTFVGLIGMCVPNFLLALLLMFASSQLLGVNISGLFSAEYATQPEWTVGKVLDLLRHIWVPIVVIGLGGTAAMVRVMRSNLLDELRRPYVTTARAKGVRPLKLLVKYPVRLALNPFVSGLGALFPQLLSGGTIVALVMSLPLVGPQLLNALMKEDMYLAGSLIMVLSLLGLLGTLLSDLLLLWLDPRVRMGGDRG